MLRFVRRSAREEVIQRYCLDAKGWEGNVAAEGRVSCSEPVRSTKLKQVIVEDVARRWCGF